MRPAVLAFVAALVVSACTVTVDGADDDGDEDVLLANPDLPDRSLFVAGATVGDVARTACSTAGVRPLAEQLLAEVNCLRPGTLTSISELPGVSLGAGALPQLNVGAASALRAATNGSPIAISSSTRATAQQYVLYYWYTHGRCTSVVSLAARPGRSNHESGLALDVPASSTWRGRLEAKGWRWLGASDPVHFDYQGTGAVDLRPLAVKAFQRLWNRNHATDRIAEDGVWGATTSDRMDRAPAAGFPVGPACSLPPPPTTVTALLTGVVYRGANASDRIAGATIRLSTGQTTTTSATGVYTVAAVAVGPVTITASKAGFAARSVTRTIEPNVDNWGSISLTAGAALIDDCGEVTAVGRCDGAVVSHCAAGGVVTVDCGAIGRSCGWNDGEAYFDCR